MLVFPKKERNLDAATLDIDMVAFHVDEAEMEDVVDYLVAAIMARCMLEFGDTAEILD